ncbi:MAG: hypothetical protein ACREMV_13800 [Gemmatimonadales bacterium]
MRIPRPRLAAATVLVAVATVGRAGGAAAQADSLTLPWSQVDLTVPEAPAFVLLGVAPSEVSRPGNVRELGVALLNGVDKSGRLRAGLAVTAAPYLILGARNLTLAAYRSSALKRLLARAQLSIATARPSGDTASTDFALGLRLVPLDAGDPRLDRALVDSIAQLLLRTLPPVPERLDTTGAAAQTVTFVPGLAERLDQLRDEAARRNWNKSRLELGLGAAWSALSSAVDSIEYQGLGAWLTGAVGIRHWGQVVLHGALRRHSVPVEVNAYRYGGRLVVGATNLNWFGEIAGTTEKPTGGSSDSRGRWTSGLEFKAIKNLWVEVGIGSEFAAGPGGRILSSVNVRWGTDRQPRIR